MHKDGMPLSVHVYNSLLGACQRGQSYDEALALLQVGGQWGRGGLAWATRGATLQGAGFARRCCRGLAWATPDTLQNDGGRPQPNPANM